MTRIRPTRAGTIEPRAPVTDESRRGHSTAARLIGAVGLVLLTSLLFWMLTDDAFRVSAADVRFEGLAHADEAAVRARLSELERGPNVFRVRASEIVSELSTLTEVDAASARVTLPAEVTVLLDERDPVFIWSNGALSWLVDEEGMLFAPADQTTAAAVRAAATGRDTPSVEEQAASGSDDRVDEAGPAADEAQAALTLTARAGLPLVRDSRSPDEEPTVGTHLGPTDLLVMRQLLALTPELLGSRSGALELFVDADERYVLKSDRGWQALFGRYTPTLQPPTVIPRQVQCLRWLLANEERKLEEVWLALSDDACGTYSTID